MYPDPLDNDDYASIVSDRHFERLQGLVEDARDKGAEVIEVNPGRRGLLERQRSARCR